LESVTLWHRWLSLQYAKVKIQAKRGLIRDIDKWLEELAPFREDYQHHQTGESNGDSHLKSLLVHHEVIVPVTAGKLDLGPWQRVFYAEFDGKRRKRLIIKVMGE
jgi:secondary thiamine-phosphate synthase enzyme